MAAEVGGTSRAGCHDKRGLSLATVLRQRPRRRGRCFVPGEGTSGKTTVKCSGSVSQCCASITRVSVLWAKKQLLLLKLLVFTELSSSQLC
ncbi:dynein light chain 4, axonemal isoform X3 [Corapipo altera]|uniref:dynein light chain 4, axonemal isoform X3 n=1 Tax=Corapipo altera TaxID=415028 RepID=UPI000FD66B48|nr:dynein light chain 4, axonemal isoform X3 [Corapipo altera]